MGQLLVMYWTRGAMSALVVLIGLCSAFPQFSSVNSMSSSFDISSSSSSTTSINQQLNTNQYERNDIFHEPGADFVLACQLPPIDLLAINSSRIKFSWQRTLTYGNSEKNAELLYFRNEYYSDHPLVPPQINWDSASGRYDLTFTNATYEKDDGRYVCKITDPSPGGKNVTRVYQLTILSPPSPPQITVPAYAAKENVEYSMSCATSQGNPEPNISWYKNDVLIGGTSGQLAASGAAYSIRVEPRAHGLLDKSTTSTLSIVPTKDDHLSTFRCSVTNRALQQRAQQSAGSMLTSELGHEQQLNVQYAPRVSVGVNNPLRVMLGEDALLQCSVDANPPVKGVRWINGNTKRFVSDKFNHTIINVKKEDADRYECHADNSMGLSSSASSSGGLLSLLGMGSSSVNTAPSASVGHAELQLQVLYGPTVMLRALNMDQSVSGVSNSQQNLASQQQQQVEYREGAEIVLECSADAQPAPYAYTWTKITTGAHQSSEEQSLSLADQTQAQLRLSNASALMSGTYECQARNRMESSMGNIEPVERSGSARIDVRIRHRPGHVQLSAGVDGRTVEGTMTKIQCVASPPGWPAPVYKIWRIPSSSPSSSSLMARREERPGSSFTIMSTKLSDEGMFGCEAQNEMGKSSNEAQVELVVDQRPTIQLALAESDTRKLGDVSYQLTARARAKPAATVTWYHSSGPGAMWQEVTPETHPRLRLVHDHVPVPLHSQSSSDSIMNGNARSSMSNKRNNNHQQQQQQQQHQPTNGQQTADVITETQAYIYFDHPLRVEDKGRYLVKFENRATQTAAAAAAAAASGSPNGVSLAALTGASSSMHLHIEHAPVMVHTQTKVAYDIGDAPATIRCRVSAYPAPLVSWWRAGVQLTDGNTQQQMQKYTTSVVPSQSDDDTFEAELSFAPVTEEDYADYECVARSSSPERALASVAPVRATVRLVHRSVPDAPTHVQQVDASQETITITWQPPFDGGYPDSVDYFVEIISTSASRVLSSTLANDHQMLKSTDTADVIDSSSSINQGLSQQSPGQQQEQTHDGRRLVKCHSAADTPGAALPAAATSTCTIDKLDARQSYTVRVKAHNPLGDSPYSEPVRVSTRAGTPQIPRPLDATFDSSQNLLYFRVDVPSGLNLTAFIHARSTQQQFQQQSQAQGQSQNGLNNNNNNANEAEWELITSLAVVNERENAYINPRLPSTGGSTARDVSQHHQNHQNSNSNNEQQSHDQNEIGQQLPTELKITLCLASNDTTCGPEYFVKLQDAESAFLSEQRALPFPAVMACILAIVVIALAATFVNSCWTHVTRTLAERAKNAKANRGNANATVTGAAAAADKNAVLPNRSDSDDSGTIAAMHTMGGKPNGNGLANHIFSANDGHSSDGQKSDSTTTTGLLFGAHPNHQQLLAQQAAAAHQQQRQRHHHQQQLVDQQQQRHLAHAAAAAAAAMQQQSYSAYDLASPLDLQHQQHQQQYEANSMGAYGTSGGQQEAMDGGPFYSNNYGINQQQQMSLNEPPYGTSRAGADLWLAMQQNSANQMESQQQQQQQQLEDPYGHAPGPVYPPMFAPPPPPTGATPQQLIDANEAVILQQQQQSIYGTLNRQQQQQQQQQAIYAQASQVRPPQQFGAPIGGVDQSPYGTVGATQPHYGHSMATVNDFSIGEPTNGTTDVNHGSPSANSANGLGANSDYGTVGGARRLMREIIV